MFMYVDACTYYTEKSGSQYDAGAVSVMSIMSIMHGKNIISLFLHVVNFFDNLIGWTMANAGDAMLK